jgi:hypothetical protein
MNTRSIRNSPYSDSLVIRRTRESFAVWGYSNTLYSTCKKHDLYSIYTLNLCLIIFIVLSTVKLQTENVESIEQQSENSKIAFIQNYPWKFPE